MTTDELIKALREWGEAFANKVDKLHFLLMQAADRLEELDERVAIMSADMDREWGNNYS